MKIVDCPLCESKKINYTSEIVNRIIKGKTIDFRGISFRHCENCSDKFFPQGSLNEMNKYHPTKN